MESKIILWVVFIILAIGLNKIAAADDKVSCVPPPPGRYVLKDPNVIFCNSAELASFEKLKIARMAQNISDDDTAVGIWQSLAKENNVFALKSLGLMGSVRGDFIMATKWYRKAADLGDAEAQIFMGNSYFQGKGVLQDYLLAYMWYNISASHAGPDHTKSESVAELRDMVAAKMSQKEISEAQNLARNWASSK